MISVSAKSRYAVSALMHLAIHNSAGAVPLAEVSICQGISMSYIDQIFWRLRRAGLVRGTPGPGGGYRLGRPPEDISIAEVIALMDAERPQRRAESPMAERLWAELSTRIESYLDGISLADFVARPQVQEAVLSQYAGRQWRCDVCGALATRQQPPSGGVSAQ
ncbi:Rrf2 family transcriptional regulator [Spiribacter sp. C176]|uniref:Rrf2 family transcriptional regulator n=2 Tax=Spiribacter salilacus TaxID=2664894 RepID=A0A6N7QQ46_9GAMM|nr:Rrf2 family transcriptional regulator [Spiribacter salilacus]MRH77258.1 Rrf2 family transcriptional regulator [Spiribacter salilacus]